MIEKQNEYKTLAINTDDYATELMSLSLHHRTANGILFFLINDMDQNNISKISQKEIMEYFGKSRQTISKAINELENLGFIEILKYGTSNIYKINDQVFKKVKGPTK